MKLVTPTQKLAEGPVYLVTVEMVVWRKIGGLTQRFGQACLVSKPSCGDKSQLMGVGVERIDIVAFLLVLWLWPVSYGCGLGSLAQSPLGKGTRSVESHRKFHECVFGCYGMRSPLRDFKVASELPYTHCCSGCHVCPHFRVYPASGVVRSTRSGAYCWERAL